jgi:hypothetical protein
MIIHETDSDRLISHYHLDVGVYANEAGDPSPLIRLPASRNLPGSDSRPRLWGISQPCQIFPKLFKFLELPTDRNLAISLHSFPSIQSIQKK